MQNEWILDVLTDLRSFAETNALPQLAEHLDDAKLIASAEIAIRDERSATSGHGDKQNTGTGPFGFGAGGHA